MHLPIQGINQLGTVCKQKIINSYSNTNFIQAQSNHPKAEVNVVVGSFYFRRMTHLKMTTVGGDEQNN